jgi:hypothetical protein
VRYVWSEIAPTPSGRFGAICVLRKRASMGNGSDTYITQIVIDPTMPTFHECTTANNASNPATASRAQ